uniref:Uncharacterized protein LOC111101352 n=1 Tax=Crassostrea virginica TaxID=6565 RepID=A0A8B8AEA7_CRAVI|nr:uncharacterized protein LOC111101352 [Crassostrea virginica]
MVSASEAWTTCCMFVPGVALHGYVFVSPHWINYNSKSECFKGVAYSSGCLDGDGEGLGSVAFGLETASFTLTVLATVFVICSVFWIDDANGTSGVAMCCMGLIYPFAGMIGLAGWMAVFVEFRTYEKGWAFYVNFITSIYFMLFCCCCSPCMINKEEKTIRRKDEGQRETQYDSV